ncbi:putative nuclease HARBI1 [Megalops cyprinoides]|uniref:putative nuclease HARBI1 n=1 Tax=Megalops cyprinoides TaxID=118141 RepID=UPI001864A017|nr:putative nuclease HARBI1 [Megalops cyprinoides]
MGCPFMRNPIDIEAELIHAALRQERVLRPRVDILSFPDEYLIERYRFSSQSLTYLNNILWPFIGNITHREHALKSEQILCIALRFFASGSFLYNISDAENIGKATVCRAVRKVCLAFKRLHNFVVFPGHKPVNVRCLTEFVIRYFAGFPNVIGCIDGTQIPITAPSVIEGDYVNRKSFHSISVQIICDAAHLITNVEAKWPGSVHDSRIFGSPLILLSVSSGSQNMFTVNSGECVGHLSLYPCLPLLMTPYPDPEQGPQQRFNITHSRTRARVEMTIGVLKATFHCLRKLRVTPERACNIIVACVVLHNIATIRGEQRPPILIENDDPIPPADVLDGRAVRDTICRNHFA